MKKDFSLILFISVLLALILSISVSADVTDTFVDEIPTSTDNFGPWVVEFSSEGEHPNNRHTIAVENNPDLGETLLMKAAAPRDAKWSEHIVYKMDKNICGFKFDVVCCAGLGNPLEDITIYISKNGGDWNEVRTQATKYVYNEDIYTNFDKAYWHNSTLMNKEKIDTGYKYIKIQFNGCNEANDVPWNIAIDKITIYMGSNEPAPIISAEDKFETYEQIYHNHKNNQNYDSTVVAPPTCTEQGYTTYTCSFCGDSYVADQTAALGHNYTAATCTAPKTCSVCGATEGETLGGHIREVPCSPNCWRCGELLDNPQHEWEDATCSRPKSCKNCSATEGEVLEHEWKAATCSRPKSCKNCSATEGEALEHSRKYACDDYCEKCGEVLGDFDHKYTSATCTKAKTCKYCGKTSGKKLGHTYSNDCDKSCNRCKASRTVPGHDYEKKITKATLTKDGVIKNVCEECGYTSSKTTKTYKASKISLSKTSYTYNGKAQKPSVVVKDSKGKTISSKYYTVTYASGRKNVGTYKVTIKFKGNYSGTKTLTFKVNPVKTTVKATAAKKSLKLTVSKKPTQVTGYEVQYSTSKSFKSYKSKWLTSYKKTSLTLTGLKAKTTYYVRVRTYKTVSGKKYYSGWSTIVYKKTK